MIEGMCEFEDGWTLPIGSTSVVRCCVDWNFVVELHGIAGDWELRIGAPFTVVRGEQEDHLEPEEEPSTLGPALSVARAEVLTAKAFRDGGLEVEFSRGAVFRVPADPMFRAWSLAGPQGFQLVSEPGGRLVTPDAEVK